MKVWSHIFRQEIFDIVITAETRGSLKSLKKSRCTRDQSIGRNKRRPLFVAPLITRRHGGANFRVVYQKNRGGLAFLQTSNSSAGNYWYLRHCGRSREARQLFRSTYMNTPLRENNYRPSPVLQESGPAIGEERKNHTKGKGDTLAAIDKGKTSFRRSFTFLFLSPDWKNAIAFCFFSTLCLNFIFGTLKFERDRK